MKTSYAMKDVPVHIEFPVVTCGACGMKFVIMPITDNNVQSDDIDSSNVWQDVSSVKFCPFCGEKEDK
jgi:hypothetical protein